MLQIPLFPLNTVLFPHMPISLNIFEPRYKLMVEECLRTGQPFGVVLIREGVEAHGPATDPHEVGCLAQITQVDRLPDGRLSIIAVGLERFEIQAVSHEQPYLTGTVEPLPLGDDSRPEVDRWGEALRPRVEEYLGMLAHATDAVQFDPTDLPADTLALAYLAAALVQIPLDQKQALLTETDAARFVREVTRVYQREVVILDLILEREAAHEPQGVFSLN